jgi:hypothetical protein
MLSEELPALAGEGPSSPDAAGTREAQLLALATEMRARWGELQGIALLESPGTDEDSQRKHMVVCTTAQSSPVLLEAIHFALDEMRGDAGRDS